MADDWSFGRIFTNLGSAIDRARPAQIHGEQVVSWGGFDRRTDALAAAFLAGGAEPGDKVAHLMRNSPAYLQTTVASFKARMVPVNVNYRYTGEELLYILGNADAAVIVYDAEFAETMALLRPRLPAAKLFLQVGDRPPRPTFAEDFDLTASSGAPCPQLAHAPDDMLFLYTGGTTGYPKGVMWDQGVLWTMLSGGFSVFTGVLPETLDEHLSNVRAGAGSLRLLVCPPLMHGTGLFMAIYILACGGSVVTLTERSFHPAEAIETCARVAPDAMVIVGDAFARPLLHSLDRSGASEMINSLRMIVSSGTMWCPETKAGLLRHNPAMALIDSFGSSESLGLGSSVHTAADPHAPTRFAHDGDTLVVDEDLKPVPPGSGVVGRIARGGLLPRGYYKDPEKTARTFVEIDGRRYSMPGDHAIVEADGAIVLMGRGSQCINTGGEKVFPEEVEEALKTHPLVDDALVFGVEDDRWGQAVTAVVETLGQVEAGELIAHVRLQLAAYKAPKRVVIVSKVPRAPNGKADYARARQLVGATA